MMWKPAILIAFPALLATACLAAPPSPERPIDVPAPTGHSDPAGKNEGDALLDRAAAAFGSADYEEAATLLEAYLALHPENLDARVRLGWCRYRSGAFERARQAFGAALEAQPDLEDARVGLGYVVLQTEGPGPAAGIFGEVLARSPDNGDALRGMVLAGLRGEAPAEWVAGALRAADRLLALDPSDRQTLEDRLKLVAKAGGSGERRLREPLDPTAPLRVPARAGPDYLQVRGEDSSWRNLFVKGFNLGAALPGKFPTEFPEDERTYREWLQIMSGLGANTVRLYTLLPPPFYRALVAHNREPGARKLYLIQGVWTELPPRHDFSGPDFVDAFRAEIARVIDAVHGNLALAPRPGHASGLYDTDASGSLLALIVGREWEPFAVRDYNELRAGDSSWRGAWLQVAGGRPMEVWVARMCDFAVGYEARRYRVLHPVTFANWPTLDPLHHPTESTRAEEDAWRDRYGISRPARLRSVPWEDDRVSLDATRIAPTERMLAGFFASYHIYPNYPDFLNLEPAYAGARDARGSSRYAGYLEALKAYHGNQPVLVAEFGISTSRGIAHVQPQGWHHGGHDEREQGELVARMLRNMWDARYAGGIVFEFLDEWFKGTWSVAPLELPPERRRLWFNAESPEQSYGVLATRPARRRIRVDGDPTDWAGIPPLSSSKVKPGDGGWASLRGLRATSDEGHLYLLLETAGGPEPPEGSIAFRIALDSYDPERGERDLPAPGALRVPTGVEFLVDVVGPGASFLRVTEPYEPFSKVGSGGPLVSPHGGTGRFVNLAFETNRERFGRDGTRYPAVRIDRGKLRHGSLDPDSPSFDTRTDLSVGAERGVLELALPWGLLNVADPSSHRVLHDESSGGPPFATAVTGGVRIYAFTLDRARPESAPLDRLPARGEIPKLYRWDGWERPEYRLELKLGAARIEQEMRLLPDTFIPSVAVSRGEVHDAR